VRSIGVPAVLVLLLVFGIAWLSELSLTTLTPPVDNIEQLTWVRSLEWGYHVHPPLPTWLLFLPVRIFGWTALVPALTGAALTLGAMALLWSLLRRLRGPRYAATALLATLCITFYSGRLDHFNHNVVLLFLNVACAAAAWRAFDAPQIRRHWIWLGVLTGLGGLAKYEVAITAVAVLGVFAATRGWRDRRVVFGLGLAAVTALVLIAPHLVWLGRHDFGPVRYALNSSLEADLPAPERWAHVGNWIADQLLNRSLPAWLVLAAGALSVRAPRTVSACGRPPAASRGLAFQIILWWGAMPVLFIAVVGLAFGSQLQSHWASPFLPFLVPAVMECCAAVPWHRVRPNVVGLAFIGVQAVLLVVAHLTSVLGPAKWQSHHWRAFPSAAIAEAIAGPARRALGGPVRVISGEPSLAGALALRLPEHPWVLIDGNESVSSWVPRGEVERCGAVEVSASPKAGTSAVPAGVFGTVYWSVRPPSDATRDRLGCLSPSSIAPTADQSQLD
jgi:4-amino-4-deoxy-L-arabinose transferase-like glycosyltransferase